MSNAALAMTGPRKIIDLDGKPRSLWRLDPGAAHLWEGKLWNYEENGCVLCVEEDDADHATLCYFDDDNKEHCVCMEHGPLVPVDYKMEKNYKYTIDGIETEGKVVDTNVMLFPESMTKEERKECISSMLGEADEYEKTEDSDE